MELKVFANFSLDLGLPVGHTFPAGSKLFFRMKRYDTQGCKAKGAGSLLSEPGMLASMQYFPPAGSNEKPKFFSGLITRWSGGAQDGQFPEVNSLLEIGAGKFSCSGAVSADELEGNCMARGPGVVWTFSS